MALSWLLILAFVGASSAFQNDVKSSRNSTILLESHPTVVQVESLETLGTNTWTQTCTGSILNNRNILTAASCVVARFYDWRYVRIRAGANFRGTGGIIHNAETGFPSPSYNIANVTTWRDDVAVVRLASYLTYSNVIQQATIAGPGSVIPAGITLTQLGWEFRNSSALSEVSVVTLNRANCGLTLNSTQSLCTASSTELDNAQPGSPLLYQGINVGLISGVNFVDNTTGTLVSADIGSYADWILSVV